MTTGSPPSSANEEIEVAWGQRRIPAQLYRTKRRVLRVDVDPSGNVTVFAPIGAPLGEVEARVKGKGAWILRQVDRVAERPPVTPERRYVSGETHLLLGKQYRLAIDQGDDPRVYVEGSRLQIIARQVDDRGHCRRLLAAFYTITARDVFRDRLTAMAPAFMRKGLKEPPLIIRKMSKRWGSFTPRGRIVLNIDLVRASPLLIDYVICHELTHAFYPDHGKDWVALFDAVMPDWERRKALLESSLR